jgi:hypothetical protein
MTRLLRWIKSPAGIVIIVLAVILIGFVAAAQVHQAKVEEFIELTRLQAEAEKHQAEMAYARRDYATGDAHVKRATELCDRYSTYMRDSSEAAVDMAREGMSAKEKENLKKAFQR